jgi:hypothetical protein
MLDQMVAAHVRLVPRLPEAQRARTADYLAELVILGDIYRRYARGWISRKEMDQQALRQSRKLDELRWQRFTRQPVDRDG